MKLGSARRLFAGSVRAFTTNWQQGHSNHVVSNDGCIVKRFGVNGDGTEIKLLDADLPVCSVPLKTDGIGWSASHVTRLFQVGMFLPQSYTIRTANARAWLAVRPDTGNLVTIPVHDDEANKRLCHGLFARLGEFDACLPLVATCWAGP